MNKGKLGFYKPGQLVRLGMWVFHDKYDKGMVVPREWRGDWWAPTMHLVIGNYSSLTGVVVLECQTTKARSEFDWQTPVFIG